MPVSDVFFLRIKLRLNIKEKRDAQLQDKLIHQWRWRFPGQHLDIFVEGILRFLKRRLYLCRDIGCPPHYNHFCLLPLHKYCSMLVRVEEISIFVTTPLKLLLLTGDCYTTDKGSRCSRDDSDTECEKCGETHCRELKVGGPQCNILVYIICCQRSR